VIDQRKLRALFERKKGPTGNDAVTGTIDGGFVGWSDSCALVVVRDDDAPGDPLGPLPQQIATETPPLVGAVLVEGLRTFAGRDSLLYDGDTAVFRIGERWYGGRLMAAVLAPFDGVAELRSHAGPDQPLHVVATDGSWRVVVMPRLGPEFPVFTSIRPSAAAWARPPPQEPICVEDFLRGWRRSSGPDHVEGWLRSLWNHNCLHGESLAALVGGDHVDAILARLEADGWIVPGKRVPTRLQRAVDPAGADDSMPSRCWWTPNRSNAGLRAFVGAPAPEQLDAFAGGAA
jgi:hypothetical protein